VETVTEGSGSSPTPNDVVLINYKGQLADGSVFDEGKNVPMRVEDLIQGFAEALQKMQIGGTYKVKIPPSLAYGDKRTGSIPPNSELHFEISLLDFKSKQYVQAITSGNRNNGVEIPQLALQCGGGDYRNGRLVFSPDDGAIYSGSVIDKKKMKSSQIWNENGNIRAVMGKSYEIIIDPKNPSSYKENSNYSPNSENDEQSCRQSIKEAKDDCAEAANFRQCMSIRHPQELSRDDGGYCSVMGSRWQEFDCDIVDQDGYNESLKEIKSYGDYSF
jgi:hypothetical protein